MASFTSLKRNGKYPRTTISVCLGVISGRYRPEDMDFETLELIGYQDSGGQALATPAEIREQVENILYDVLLDEG